MPEANTTRARLRQVLAAVRRPSFLTGALLLLGAIVGVLFWGGFNTALEATNSLAFCTSCHEMRDTVFQEYKTTIHYQNRTGVRAICPDCHVPRDWTHMVIRKLKASGEVWGKITGDIDTKEKFEARRMALAQNEWNTMKSTDSRECRNCHSFAAMAAGKQRPAAQRNHAEAQKEGKTCIDCHKGIAHLLPKEYQGDDE
ncbi:MAG TPA: NapC/NirT family cytochrome c [Steroidobacteraceae bacterium]|nr:NapC/NirT family cytochrome c [Steroidobacteraceae bacterium]